jgi:hypothetical protein
VSSSSPPLQRIPRLSSTFPSACLTFATRSCFDVVGKQADIAGYNSKLAKDAIPTSQFSHSAELQKIPSHRDCSQQTKSFPRAQLSLSLSRGTCSIASDTTIHPTKSLVHSHSLDSVDYSQERLPLRSQDFLDHVHCWRQNSSRCLEILDRTPPRFSTASETKSGAPWLSWLLKVFCFLFSVFFSAAFVTFFVLSYVFFCVWKHFLCDRQLRTLFPKVPKNSKLFLELVGIAQKWNFKITTAHLGVCIK